MTGSLKRNDKGGIETRPDYRGKITLQDGSEFWVSGWINSDKETGEKYMSLKLQPKEQQVGASVSAHNASKANGYAPEVDSEDDIPF